MAGRTTPAQTAFGPTMFAAAERFLPPERRVTQDDLAMGFLPAGLRLMTRLMRWRLVRELAARAIEKDAPGLWGGMLARKRYADDQVADALDSGIGQVVFLGAGLDTRAFRLVAPVGAEAIEVDLPANVAYKRERVRHLYGEVPEHVTLVPVDFETDDLEEALTRSGFRFGRPALFVWEAVTQYLTEDGVGKTLATLAKAAAGSRLVFTTYEATSSRGETCTAGRRATRSGSSETSYGGTASTPKTSASCSTNTGGWNTRMSERPTIKLGTSSRPAAI